MSAEEMTAELYSRQGFVVMASRTPKEIGFIETDCGLDTESLNMPLRVVAVSTEQELLKQEALAMKLFGLGSPQISSVPSVGGSNVPKIWSRVVFPSPDFPVIATVSPALIWREMFFKTETLMGFLKLLETLEAIKIVIRTSRSQRGLNGRLSRQG